MAGANTGRLVCASMLFALALGGCATTPRAVYRASSDRPRAYNRAYVVDGRTYTPAPQPGYDQVGVASWYGYESGRRTSSGERLSERELTVAHRTLPIPSILEITNLENGRRVRARLNDRGPFRRGRLIDVSREAARELGFLAGGSTRVRVRYLGPADPRGGTTLAELAPSASFETAATVVDRSPLDATRP